MAANSASNLPQHIAIIMDGNNRWAKSRGENSRYGHQKGAQAARDVLQACIDRKIPYLTLFAFSSENWLRPEEEVQGLMSLFMGVLKRKEIKNFKAQGVRFRFAGSRTGFSESLLNGMSEIETETKNNAGTTVTIAADYGGRWDITEAAKALAKQCLEGELEVDEITPERLEAFHSLAGIPDPDLCIRTGGEQRISNFLLWQLAYSELYFTECYWPDFKDKDLDLAIEDYAGRQRRYGGSGDVENPPGKQVKATNA